MKIGDTYSEDAELLYGVVQGSILGPQLFNIYIRSLYQRVEPSRFEIVGFADDHQLIKQFIITLKVPALGDDIRNCLNVIGDWMNEFFLCLNQTKTKILVVAPLSILKKIVINGVILEHACIRFVESAKNLGVVIDSLLNFEEHISKVVNSCFDMIRKLSKVKVFLTQQHLQELVSARILTKVDYCNVIYYGLPALTIKKLQHVQNCAARLVWKGKIPPHSSLDHIFLSLHWLKIKFRIIFKILFIVHNCLHNNAPLDVCALIVRAQSQRTFTLVETRVNSNYGDRAFSHVAPKLWNLLPVEIREEHDLLEYKKKLKSFLMRRGDEFISWTKRK